MKSQEERYLAIRNVTLIGVVGNIFLTIIKLFFGFYGKSQALIADGLHSLSDLMSDAVVLIAAKFSTQAADADHPYGHARFETLATVIVGGILLMVGIGMLIDTTQRLFDPTLLLQTSSVTLSVALLSILIKEALYQYTHLIATRIRSQMLEANAWHHRTDAISSVFVLIGIAGSLLGVSWLDAVAALIVSVMIIHIGWSLGWGGVMDLVDTGLAKDKIISIKKTIQSVEGVQTLHALRSRKMGANVLIDVHIMVDPRISVSEGHQIGEMVRSTIMKGNDAIKDVLVHIDPEFDISIPTNLNLPLRDEITERVRQYCQTLKINDPIEKMTLHYLSGKVTVDIYFSLSIADNIVEAQNLSLNLSLNLNKLLVDDPVIHGIKVYYST